MKALFGNVVKVIKKTDTVITVRFAIDRHLQFKDKNTGQYDSGTYFVDLKFFPRIFDKFYQCGIEDGTRLKLSDIDVSHYTKDYDPKNQTVTSTSYIVNDFEKLTKQVSQSLEEKPKSNIIRDKPISQYKPDENPEEDGNPSWMNE
jgi:hypothetical protein